MAVSFLKQNIKQASIIIAIFTVSSQLLGIIREALIANYFGTSAELDILLMALAIPLMFSSIFFMAIPSAGIPFLQKSQKNSTFNQGLFKTSYFKTNSILILIASLTLFIILPLFRSFLSGNLDEGQIDSVIKFGRLFCLLIPLKAYEAIFRSLLHLRYHFLFPTITNLVFNVVIIIVLSVFFPVLASWALVLAWLTGTFVQALIVGIPSYFIYKKSKNPEKKRDFNTNGYIKYFGVIVLIESFGLVVSPFDRYLGGIFLEAGYVSAIAYSEILISVPFRIFGISMGTAIFPTLSEKAVKRDFTSLSALHHKAIAICIMLIIPITVFSLIFSHEIVSLLFERGRFIARSRIITVEIMRYYLIGLFFCSVFYIQAKTFYALKLWRPLGLIKLFALILKCIIGFYLIKINWAQAIGGGSFVMYFTCFVLLELYLVFRLGMKYSSNDIKTILKASFSAIATIFLFLALYLTLQNFIDKTILMFISGIVSFSGLVIMDLKFNVTGIKYSTFFNRTRILNNFNGEN